MLTIDLLLLPILETDRLILREHTLTDAAAFYALRTNEEVMRYIDRLQPKNIQESEEVIKAMDDGFKKGANLNWVIALKEAPEVMIGNIGFWRLDLPNHRAELGYMLHPDYWRKGIVSEALVAILDFAFNTINFHSICANINPGNDASRQMLLKHGFVKEAYFKEDYFFKGQFLDSEIYGLLNPEH